MLQEFKKSYKEEGNFGDSFHSKQLSGSEKLNSFTGLILQTKESYDKIPKSQYVDRFF